MTARLLLIDNYDSYTYNLFQYLRELGAQVEVFRNDAIDVAGIRARRPDGVVISPGPCTPNEAGVTLPAIKELGGELPMVGVCLGHQAIAQAFGGKIIRNFRIFHGKTSPVLHEGKGVFEGLPSPLTAGRYHSLVVERKSLPAELEVTGWTEEGEIMALRHRTFDLEGLQFHPESILTENGRDMLANWLKRVARKGSAGNGAPQEEAAPRRRSPRRR